MQSAGWMLQLLALVIVGSALLIGLLENALRAELVLLGVGGVIFLLGRWMLRRGG